MTTTNTTITIKPRQANFLAAFELKYGRPATVTRKALVSFRQTWANGEKGPFGFNLRWPAWLTNSSNFTVQRAVYALPWNEYDAFLASASNGSQPVTPTDAADPATN